MNLRTLLTLITTIELLTGCDNSSNTKTETTQKLDYTDKSIIDSLIKATPHSSDTMFLGFRAGMTKSDYQKHIQILRDEGKSITYSSSNIISTLAGTFELGAGYTFKTSISTEKWGKTITGKGDYILEPNFNNNDNLVQLNILPIEDWDGNYGLDKPNWLKTKVKENSTELADENLKQALIDNKIVDKYRFVRQKGSLVIYETILTVNYIDLKTLLVELLIKEVEKEIVTEQTKEIKF